MLPLHVGVTAFQTPLLHVSVGEPNKSNPVEHENEAFAPWEVSLPCKVPLAGVKRGAHDFSSKQRRKVCKK